MADHFFGLAQARTDGEAVEFDPGAPKLTAEEIKVLRIEQRAREAAWTPFAKKWAKKLAGGRGEWYEVSFDGLVEDLMEVEKDLRERIKPHG